MKKTLLNLMKTKMAKASILIFIILMLSLSTALAQFTWTTTQTGFDQSWFGITYGNGVFVAVAQNGTGNRVMTSPDGIAWTTRSSAANYNWTSVTYGNNLFVAVAIWATGNGVMTSPDGINWTSRTSAADYDWRSVTYGNGLFVAVASSGTGNRVMTSPDGINWTSRTSAADNDWRSVTYGNGLFVAVAIYATGNGVMTSPDGINWTSRTSAADYDWRSVTYGNGLFVAVASSGTGNRVMTSPDGITWTLRASAADNAWHSVIYGNGLFVAVSTDGSGNRVMTSTDGFTWTSRTSAANNSWNSVNYGNGVFVAVANNGEGNRVMTSPDGITWISVTYFPQRDWYSVTFGNGVFVAVATSGTGNRVMTSPDGINLTIRSSAADNIWRSVTYGNGLFVAVSADGIGNRVMTSPDGITWTSRSSAVDNNWFSVTYGNGLFVAVANSGVGNRVMTSPDGITWTSQTSAVDNSWRSVTYGNGLFVAVANSGAGNRVMTSPDGIAWTSQTSAADNGWTSVTFGKGLFVAVSSTGLMTSPDGSTWTSRTPATSNDWSSVIYGNGLFVAVSGDGAKRVMTSPDGITWTSQNSAVSNYWRSVTFGNGVYVAVATNGGGDRVMKSFAPVPILPPTAQPTNLYFSTTKTGGNNNIVLHYTASASAEKYLIVRKTGSVPTFVPSDDTEYTAGAQGDEQIVYAGTAITGTDATVTSDIAYHYKIYAYNGSAATTKYLTTSPLSGNTTVYSAPATLPVTSATVSAGFPNAGVTVTFPSGTTGTTLTVTQTALAPVANFSVLPGVRGVKNLYFTITSTNPAPGTFILIVDFSSLGLTEAQWNNFKVLKRANAASAWVDVTTLGATITSRQTDGIWGKFTISGLTSFSEFAGGEAATTFTVVSAAETGAGTLKNLIVGATAGDIIDFNTTSMGGNTITLSSPVVIDKDLTIRGAAGGIILNGNNATRVMTVNDAVTARLENLKIQNGNDPAFYVGGIKNEGKLTMINCVVSENIATGSLAIGGVLSWDFAPLDGDLINLVNCTISGNTGDPSDGAGGFYGDGTVNIYNTIISGNTGFYSDVDETINEIAESYNSLFGNDVSSKITAGTGNLFSQNPLFVGIVANPTHPYAIGAASPCADAGADSYSFETTDIRGGTFGRKLNKTTGATGTIDMGAYEFNPGLTWDGSESNDWNTAGNWSSNTVPFSTDDVLIPNTVSNYPTLGAAGACNNITMQSGASLLGNAYLTVSGTAAVDRAIPGASQAWHFLSSPVAAQAISPAFTADPATSYDIFAWYEPTGEWVNFKNTTIAPTWNTANVSTNFTVGKGYLVEYLGTGLTKQFTGSLNAGSVSPALTKSGTGDYAAYNLVGNPYPSAMDWKAASGWTRTSLAGSDIAGYDMSIWNDVAGQYGSFNSAGSSGNNDVTQYIAVGEGFMVKATSAGTLGMADGVRVHNTQAYLKSTDAIANILRVKVAGNANTYSDEIVVEFGHPTANGGAEKMFSFYETAPSLYTVKPDGKYSVDFRGEPGAVTIPLSFKAGADGSYTLTTSQLESFTSSTDITLEDLKLNTTQSLMQNPVYTFSSTKTDDGARFLLHFGGAFSIGENAKGKPIMVYASGNTVCISNTSGGAMNGDVYVYNTIGQLIMQQKLGGETQAKITLNVTTGCYLVKVVTSENTCSTKIFVK